MVGLSSIWAAKLRASLTSLVVVLLSQLVLAMVPRQFPSIHVLAMVPIAALAMVVTHALAGWLRRLLCIEASAPAMVICYIAFIWGVHITIVRGGEAIPKLLDAALNMEFFLLFIGLYRICNGDPGTVSNELTCIGVLGQAHILKVDHLNKSFPIISRIRYCYICKRSVKGFDHHCPAFGNCIGEKNHHLFMALVIGFIVTETTLLTCLNRYINALSYGYSTRFKSSLPGNLVISTMLFSLIQFAWQVPFLAWHIYCICCNIKTEEWINWNKYSEFQMPTPLQQGNSFTVPRFVNPYNRGVLSNAIEYLAQILHANQLTD